MPRRAQSRHGHSKTTRHSRLVDSYCNSSISISHLFSIFSLVSSDPTPLDHPLVDTLSPSSLDFLIRAQLSRGRSPSRFDQLLAAEVGRAMPERTPPGVPPPVRRPLDASERSPEGGEGGRGESGGGRKKICLMFEI